MKPFWKAVKNFVKDGFEVHYLKIQSDLGSCFIVKNEGKKDEEIDIVWFSKGNTHVKCMPIETVDAAIKNLNHINANKGKISGKQEE